MRVYRLPQEIGAEGVVVLAAVGFRRSDLLVKLERLLWLSQLTLFRVPLVD